MKLKRLTNTHPAWTLDDTYDIYFIIDPRQGDYLRIVKKGENPYNDTGFTYKPKKMSCEGEVIRQEEIYENS